jgi:hypothetical protein
MNVTMNADTYSRKAPRFAGALGRAALALAMAALMVPAAAHKSLAGGGCPCICAFPAATTTIALIDAEHDQTRTYFGTALPITPPPGTESPLGTGRLGQHETFLMRDMFKMRVLPALQMMTEQLTAVMMHQMLITGAFFDAKNQLETQLLFQKLGAQAYRDYQPNLAMCEFGTAARSLGAASRMSRIGAYALNRQYLLRHLGNQGSSAGLGPDSDRGGNEGPLTGRLGLFRAEFCDYHDSNKLPERPNTGLFFCAKDETKQETMVKGFVNRDIDFGRTIMMPRTINTDMTKASEPNATDNSAVVAMSANLYGHDVFKRDKDILKYANTNDEYMDSRSITAKRAVAQASFNDIVSLKMRGSDTPQPQPGQPAQQNAGSSIDTGNFLKNIVRQLGGTGAQWDQAAMQNGDISASIDNYLTGMSENGDYKPANQMSYFSQMEFIAKKFYQRPEFYTNLYTDPVNLKRQSVSMQAVGLMLDRNLYESHLRSEMLLSMILELRLRPLQMRVQDNLGVLTTDTTTK